MENYIKEMAAVVEVLAEELNSRSDYESEDYRNIAKEMNDTAKVVVEWQKNHESNENKADELSLGYQQKEEEIKVLREQLEAEKDKAKSEELLKKIELGVAGGSILIAIIQIINNRSLGREYMRFSKDSSIVDPVLKSNFLRFFKS